ncbi:MAG: hypothetical protein IKE38_01920 [Erysipelotrichaceae bacterium]|nr:hypothetical protein [Erysipelotrichaceae bacterium]
MPLLYSLPVITAGAFVAGLLLMLDKAKGKSGKYIFLSVMMIGTGIMFSLTETFIIFKRCGTDNGAVLEKLPFFILALAVDSLNCLLKGILMRKGFTGEDGDYAKAISKANALDFLSVLALIAVILVYR